MPLKYLAQILLYFPKIQIGKITVKQTTVLDFCLQQTQVKAIWSGKDVKFDGNQLERNLETEFYQPFWAMIDIVMDILAQLFNRPRKH